MRQRRRGQVILSLVAAMVVAACPLPGHALDLGGDEAKPAKKCPTGKAWSDRQKKCVALKSGSLTDDDLALAGRQLARDGNFHEAIEVLGLVTNKDDPIVLTYLGYSQRKLGNIDLGISLYLKALDIDPENVDTREYLGEGFVTKGQLELAWLELKEIEKRCGTSCKEYQVLEQAMRSSRSQY